MAKSKNKPGPKPKYGERRDYHILLPMELVKDFEVRAKEHGGVIAYVEGLVRKDLEENARND